MPITATESETINPKLRTDADRCMEQLIRGLKIAIPAAEQLLTIQRGQSKPPIMAVTGPDIWPHRRVIWERSASLVTVLLRLGWTGAIRGSQSGSGKKPSE